MESGTTEWAAMMNRLERLEKQNRRFKQIGALALILVGSVLLMGQAPITRTVEANEFIVKDANGKQRASLGLFGNQPTLSLFGESGKVQAALSVVAGFPSLILSDASGELRAMLGVRPDGQELALYDANGKLRAELSVLFGRPELSLFDASGKRRVALDETTLELSDEAGFKATIGTVNLGTPRTGEHRQTSAASVVLFDKDDHVIWQAP